MEIKILDSGWYSRDRIGTQADAADRAGYDGSSSVSTFTLKVKSIKQQSGANIETNPIPGSTSLTELNYVSSENPVYTLKCIVSKDDATAGFDNSMMYELLRLESTAGIKLMYPSDTSDDKKTIVELVGAANTSGVFQGSGKELTAGTPYLEGRFKKIAVADTANTPNFEISLTFQEE